MAQILANRSLELPKANALAEIGSLFALGHGVGGFWFGVRHSLAAGGT